MFENTVGRREVVVNLGRLARGSAAAVVLASFPAVALADGSGFVDTASKPAEPIFYPNELDDNHCLQVSVRSVLHTLGFPLTAAQIDRETQYDTRFGTWTAQGAVVVAQRVPGTYLYTPYDYERFIKEGESYLVNINGEGEGMDYDRRNSSAGFYKERSAAARALAMGIVKPEYFPTPDEVFRWLDTHYIIPNINSRKLAQLDGPNGHFTVLYGTEGDNILMNDPGLPPRQGVRITIDQFDQAALGEMIVIPKQ